MSRPKRLAATKAATKFRPVRDPEDDNESPSDSRDTTAEGDDGSISDVESEEEAEESEMDDTARPFKRRRIASKATPTTTRPAVKSKIKTAAQPETCNTSLSSKQRPSSNPIPPSKTPGRRNPNHSPTYHHPLLLSPQPQALTARNALLTWFDSVSTSRAMPWRKPWLNPADYTSDNAPALRQALEKRAYEVWISEIMLQQTRVATVIDYWNRWMSRWPTIQDLAKAEADGVLSAWRGLGYYSRATRIHAAAKIVCGKEGGMGGLLPCDVGELERKVPGVGRYTAGAICAIVFGRATPMVDGNVLRVLSRQLGVCGDIKADKAVISAIWQAADGLVKQVARDGAVNEDEISEDPPVNDRPGRWGQALMELGSTVCTPKPNCQQCPITSTCRAYNEGYALAVDAGEVSEPKDGTNGLHTTQLQDIEDICTMCDPLEEGIHDLLDTPNSDADSDERKTKPTKSKKSKSKSTAKTSSFFPPTNTNTSTPSPLPPKAITIITAHAQKYPLKTIKKTSPHQESQVIAIRRASDNRYLLQRRPPKGLLASLWELPSQTFPALGDTGVSRNSARISRKNINLKASKKGSVVSRTADESMAFDVLTQSELIVSPKGKKSGDLVVEHVGELGIVPWTFSHIKMTMYVQLFVYKDEGESVKGGKLEWVLAGSRQKWATREEIDAESMGTGMRRCWDLVKEAEAEDR